MIRAYPWQLLFYELSSLDTIARANDAQVQPRSMKKAQHFVPIRGLFGTKRRYTKTSMLSFQLMPSEEQKKLMFCDWRKNKVMKVSGLSVVFVQNNHRPTVLDLGNTAVNRQACERNVRCVVNNRVLRCAKRVVSTILCLLHFYFFSLLWSTFLLLNQK